MPMAKKTFRAAGTLMIILFLAIIIVSLMFAAVVVGLPVYLVRHGEEKQ